MAWVRAIGGRLKSDFRISSELVYNTFPWPDRPAGAQRRRVEEAARDVLAARQSHADSTLADLYDPLAMPADLMEAHRDLDRAADALYGRGSFDEVKRLGTLLTRYRALTSIFAASPRRPRASARA